MYPLSSSALKWGPWEGSKVSRASQYPAGPCPQPTCSLPSVGGGQGVVFSKTTRGDSRHQTVSTQVTRNATTSEQLYSLLRTPPRSRSPVCADSAPHPPVLYEPPPFKLWAKKSSAVPEEELEAGPRGP